MASLSVIGRLCTRGNAACWGTIDSRAANRHARPLFLLIWLAAPASGSRSAWQGSEPLPDGGEAESKADSAAIEFFEKSVRPILAARCQGCHGPAKQKGGLRLDARAALIAGGSTGPAIVPGNPKESLLVDAINYGDTYQMPPKSKLPDAEIATLTEWVKRGAPWGVETRTIGGHGHRACPEVRPAFQGRISRTRHDTGASSRSGGSPPLPRVPAAVGGHATRSINSFWRRSQTTGSRPRPRPTGGR